MNTLIVVHEIRAAVDALPPASRPYLLALVLAEKGLAPELGGLLAHILRDAVGLVDEQHMALVAVHIHKQHGNLDAAARASASIDYANTSEEARAACVFMAGLPALIQAAQESVRH